MTPTTQTQNDDPQAWLDSGPSFSDPDWLPAGLFGPLDEVRAKHRAALRRLADATAEGVKATEAYKAEDDAELEAVKNGQPVPELTPRAEREEASRRRSLEREAARDHLVDVCREAVALVQEHEMEWQGRLNVLRDDYERAAEEARAALLLAEHAVRKLQPTAIWIRRTATGEPYRMIPLATLGVPPAHTPLSPAANAEEERERPADGVFEVEWPEDASERPAWNGPVDADPDPDPEPEPDPVPGDVPEPSDDEPDAEEVV